MDSTPAACAAAPEWHWFWVWFGLLVLVNVATEIALCTIAATTRHLLVCLTSLGHHIWGATQDSAQQTRRLQNGCKRWIFAQKLRLGLLSLLSHLTSHSQTYPPAPSNP